MKFVKINQPYQVNESDFIIGINIEQLELTLKRNITQFDNDWCENELTKTLHTNIRYLLLQDEIEYLRNGNHIIHGKKVANGPALENCSYASWAFNWENEQSYIDIIDNLNNIKVRINFTTPLAYWFALGKDRNDRPSILQADRSSVKAKERTEKNLVALDCYYFNSENVLHHFIKTKGVVDFTKPHDLSWNYAVITNIEIIPITEKEIEEEQSKMCYSGYATVK